MSTKRKRRILFVDRDGTLIIEPPDHQIDSLEKLELVPAVIPALLALQKAGYELVIVSNQDGLGTDSYAQADYDLVQEKMLSLFGSQGIRFDAIHIDKHFEHEGSRNRKPSAEELATSVAYVLEEIEVVQPSNAQIQPLALPDHVGSQEMMKGRFILTLPKTAIKGQDNMITVNILSNGRAVKTVTTSFVGP